MVNTARALLTLLLLILITLILIPFQVFGLKRNKALARNLPVLWHKFAQSLLGLRITIKGRPVKGAALLISNHISWLDIVALSTSKPLSFIAKQEVSSWPAFGLLAKLQRTLFVNRERRSETAKRTSDIATRLQQGDTLVLFAEGTSTEGAQVLPFRPALLGGAVYASKAMGTVTVQPVSIAYTAINGLPIGTSGRTLTGFYGDTEMAPHLWRVLKCAAIDAVITFGDPVIVTPNTDRKQLAKMLHQHVQSMTVTANTR